MKSARIVVYGGKLPAEAGQACVAKFYVDCDPSAQDHAYLYDLGTWGAWCESRWSVNDKGDLLLAEDVGRLCSYLRHAMPDTRRDKSERDYRTCFLSADYRAGLRSEIKPLLQKLNFARLFDQHEFLLGIPGNCVIDLSSGTIRAARREDFLTRRIDVIPDRNMPTPVWDKFLLDIMEGSQEMADFLNRLAGYCLTGSTREHGWFIFFGTGRNGKGVYGHVLQEILSEYSVSLRLTELAFSQNSGDTMKRTNAKLHGKRLAWVEEGSDKKGHVTLDTRIVKTLTGNDPLPGAKLFQNEVTIRPTHKLLTSLNNRPVVSCEPAMQGRIHLIPFNVCFMEGTAHPPDRKLEEKLRLEYPGILWKLMQGCKQWLERGSLQAPEAVRSSTKNLFEEMNVAGHFIAEQIVVEAEAFTFSDELQSAFTAFARDAGIPAEMKDLNEVLSQDERFKREKRRVGNRQGRGWSGFRLAK
jgi:P4 family phage/plasmid primase-like protien